MSAKDEAATCEVGTCEVGACEVGACEAIENTESVEKTREEIEHANVVSFFSVKENFARLRVFSSKRSREVVVYFLSHFDQSQLESPPDFDMGYRYRLVITRNRKKYFDFVQDAGKGEFVLAGVTNPGIPSLCDLTVPNLVALRWFISNQLDRIFQKNRALIESNFDRFRFTRKIEYRENADRKHLSSRPVPSEVKRSKIEKRSAMLVKTTNSTNTSTNE